MNLSKNYIVISTLLSFALLGTGAMAYADQVVGTAINVSGALFVKKEDGTIKVLAERSQVAQGDTLISNQKTYARIKFIDDSELTLRPDTQLKIDIFSYDETKPEKDSAIFVLLKGGVRSITGKLGKRSNDKVHLNTPAASIDARSASYTAHYVPLTEASKQATRQASTFSRAQYLFASTASLSASATMSSPLGRTISDVAIGQSGLAYIPLRLAQNTTPTPLPGGGGLAPGLYVHVIDGLIQLSNRGGVQQFAAGQFGFTGSIVQPPLIVPNNPGIQFNPPPAFSSSTVPQKSAVPTKDKTVDCEVR